jgi:hypothetical protein
VRNELRQAAGKIGSCLKTTVDGFDLALHQSIVKPGPIGQPLRLTLMPEEQGTVCVVPRHDTIGERVRARVRIS